MKKVLSASTLAIVMASQAMAVPMAAEAPKADVPKTDAPKNDAPKTDATKDNKAEGMKLERISGVDRYDTSMKLSAKSFDKAENVVIASGKQFPDALAGGVLAGYVKGPVILTKGDKVSDELSKDLERLQTKKVYLLGGENTISKAFQEELAAKKLEVVRIAGADRYETSINIAKELRKLGAGNDVALASGKSFPDALSAAPAMAKLKTPIVLTDNNLKPIFTDKSDIKADQVKYIIGGPNTVGNTIGKANLSEVKRIAGKDRYETSVKVAEEFFAKSTKAIVASGKDYPDALSAVGYAYKIDAPILLSSKDVLIDQAKSFIKDHKIADVTVVGGPNSVSDKVMEMIKGLDLNEADQAKAIAEQVKKSREALKVVDQDYVIPFEVKSGETVAQAKERAKKEIIDILDKADKAVKDGKIDKTEYEKLMKEIKPKHGLIGHLFYIDMDVAGDKVVKGKEEGKDAVAKYIRVAKDKEGNYEFVIKTKAKDFVRDDGKDKKDPTKVKKYIKINLVDKDKFEKVEDKNKVVGKDNNIDVITSPTIKYAKDTLAPVKVGGDKSENYTVTPVADGYKVVIKGDVIDGGLKAAIIKPIMIDKLSDGGVLENGTLVFVNVNAPKDK